MAHHGHSIGSIVIHCIIVFGVIGIALAGRCYPPLTSEITNTPPPHAAETHWRQP